MKILLVSHGGMAEGMRQSLEMICGRQPQVMCESLNDGEGIVDFEHRLNLLLERLKDESLLVLTDLTGGSPNTTCVKLLAQKGKLADTPVIAGMNLPLLISVIHSTEGGDDVDKHIEDARGALQRFQIKPENNQEEEL